MVQRDAPGLATRSIDDCFFTKSSTKLYRLSNFIG
jgi:hypothetical protein